MNNPARYGFIHMLSNLNEIKKDFYKNIDYLFQDDSIAKDGKASRIGIKIAEICLDISIKLGKFRYKMHEQDCTLPTYKIRDSKQYVILDGHTLDELEEYYDDINLILKDFNSEIFNLEKYSELDDNKTKESFEFEDDFFLKYQLIENLLKRLKLFIDSQNSRLIFKILDTLYRNHNNNKNLEKILESYKKNIMLGEEHMLKLRTYKYITKPENIPFKKIHILEDIINNYIYFSLK